MGLALKASHVLKVDASRVLCLARKYWGRRDDVQYLHPATAVVVSLLDGSRSGEDAVGAAVELFGSDAEGMARRILIEMAPLLEEVDHPRPDLDPSAFVVPGDQVAMDRPRCEKPISLIAHITWQCSRACRYCYAEPSPKGVDELAAEDWGRVFSDAASLGITSVQFSGGDSLCRPDWRELVESAVGRGIAPLISTKHAVSRDDAQFLRAHAVDEVQVSIDSADSETCRHLTGSSSFLEEMLCSIRNLRSAGIDITCNAVITSANADGIPDLVHLLEAFGVAELSLSPCMQSLYRDVSELFPSPGQKNLVSKVVRNLSTPLKVTYAARIDPLDLTPSERATSFLSRPLCSAGRLTLALCPDGTAVPCPSMPRGSFGLGRVPSQSLMSIWDSEALLAFMLPSRDQLTDSSCRSCEEWRACHVWKGRCVKYALLAYGDSSYPDPYCPRAPRGNRVC